nr:MAG TPA: hypothetical protein [Caudoviricetes sp.]
MIFLASCIRIRLVKSYISQTVILSGVAVIRLERRLRPARYSLRAGHAPGPMFASRGQR